MSVSFNKAVEIVLASEGVFSDDPRDNGGTTKYGISQKAYPQLDIKSLTVEQAKALYKKDYWDKGKCELLTWPMALCLFDGLVNQGPVVIKLMQMAVGVKADGLIGKMTVDRVNCLDDVQQGVALFMAMRAQRYAQLDDFPVYGKGWMKRLFDVYYEAFNAK